MRMKISLYRDVLYAHNSLRTDMVLMGGHDIGTTDEKVVKILINKGDYQFEVKQRAFVNSSSNIRAGGTPEIGDFFV